MVSLHGTDDSAHLEPLGSVAVVIDFPDMGGCKPDLVAVAGIAMRSLSRDHLLRKLSRDGLGNRLVDVSRSGHPHCLIDIGTPRERVSDGTTQTGRSTSERLDLRRMVVSLVLEHQEPFLRLPVHIHINEYAAGVVLLAHLHVIELPFLPEVTRSDCGHVHQIQAFVLASELLPHLQVKIEGPVDLLLDEGFLHIELLQFGGEGGVAAMVAPVGVQDAEFRLVGVTAFCSEVLDDFLQVLLAHREPHLPAVLLEFLRLHGIETIENRDWLDVCQFGLGQLAQVLWP